MMKMQGSFCLPISFLAQHLSRPKSTSRRGVYSSRLVRPESTDISLWMSTVSRSLDSVHPKLTASGSASTWQRKVTGCSRDTTTVRGFERRHTGASTKSQPEVLLTTDKLQQEQQLTFDVKMERKTGRLDHSVNGYASIIAGRFSLHWTDD